MGIRPWILLFGTLMLVQDVESHRTPIPNDHSGRRLVEETRPATMTEKNAEQRQVNTYLSVAPRPPTTSETTLTDNTSFKEGKEESSTSRTQTTSVTNHEAQGQAPGRRAGESEGPSRASITPAEIPPFLRAIKEGFDKATNSMHYQTLTVYPGKIGEGELPASAITFNIKTTVEVTSTTYVQLIFHPVEYAGPNRSFCSLTLCTKQTVCKQFLSEVTFKKFQSHSLPTQYLAIGAVELVPSVLTGDIWFREVICNDIPIYHSPIELPLLVFHPSKAEADHANMCADLGWKTLRGTSMPTAHPKSKRGRSRRVSSEGTKRCHRKNWIVTAADLDWHGELIEPRNLDIGFCHGVCIQESDMSRHAAMRKWYLHWHGSSACVKEPSCVATRLGAQSVIISAFGNYRVEYIPQIKVQQCSCR